MLGLLAMVAIGATGASPTTELGSGSIAERRLSATRAFLGVYVTNFEIGYFVECNPTDGGCLSWAQQEPRWLDGDAKGKLQRLWRCIARWNGSKDRWALYSIAFTGKETLDRKEKTFLHDTERRVNFSSINGLDLIGTDDTIGQMLPRYRSAPKHSCR